MVNQSIESWESTTTCNGNVTDSAKEDVWSGLILIANRVGKFLVYVFSTHHIQELFKDTTKAYFYKHHTLF